MARGRPFPFRFVRTICTRHGVRVPGTSSEEAGQNETENREKPETGYYRAYGVRFAQQIYRRKMAGKQSTSNSVFEKFDGLVAFVATGYSEPTENSRWRIPRSTCQPIIVPAARFVRETFVRV